VALPVEQPQLRFSVGGAVVPGAIALEIESVGYFAADRFHASFAMGATASTTADFFTSLGGETVNIEVAPSGFGFTSLLTGQIDNIRLDLVKNTATLSGRDLSARLIDTEITETFANQTASQIAATIAARHQLAANVAATKTPVGQYYELDHARTALGLHARMTTEWNLLSALAQAENFVLSVTGNTLNFGPPPASTAIFLTPQSFSGLVLDMTSALPAAARVKSWNSRQKAVVSGTQGSGATTTLIRPNLTSALAQAMAENHLSAISQHGVVLYGTMPADVSTMPGMTIVLAGTNSDFDRSYTISAVARSLQARAGLTQKIYASAMS
jgi:phage protein D